MSPLGKILLYVALAGGVVALIFGGLIVKKRQDDVALQQRTEALEKGAEAKAAKATADAAALTIAKAKSDSDLADATKSLSDATDKVTDLQKQVSDGAVALAAATDAQKKAQDQLDTITKTFNGKTADQIVADEAKAKRTWRRL